MQQLKTENMILRQRVDELEHQLALKERQIAELQASVAELSKQHDAAREDLKEYDSLTIRQTVGFFAGDAERLEQVDLSSTAAPNEDAQCANDSLALPGDAGYPAYGAANTALAASRCAKSVENQPVELGCTKATLHELGTLFRQTLCREQKPTATPEHRAPTYLCKYHNIRQIIEYLRYGLVTRRELPDFSRFESEPGHFVLVLTKKAYIEGLALYEGGGQFATVYMNGDKRVEVGMIRGYYKIVKQGRMILQSCGPRFGPGVDAILLDFGMNQ